MSKDTSGEFPDHITTTLGKETSFVGTLKFSDSLKIDGSFEGEIDATGFLYIDKGATIKAKRIKASSIIVAGVVHGDIEAVDKVELLPTAKVYGNVKTAKLRISDGVVFEGKCEMIRNADSVDIFSGSADSIRSGLKNRL